MSINDTLEQSITSYFEELASVYKWKSRSLEGICTVTSNGTLIVHAGIPIDYAGLRVLVDFKFAIARPAYFLNLYLIRLFELYFVDLVLIDDLKILPANEFLAIHGQSLANSVELAGRFNAKWIISNKGTLAAILRKYDKTAYERGFVEVFNVDSFSH